MTAKNKYAHAAAMIVMGESSEAVQELYGFDRDVLDEVELAADALENGDYERFYRIIRKLTRPLQINPYV